MMGFRTGIRWLVGLAFGGCWMGLEAGAECACWAGGWVCAELALGGCCVGGGCRLGLVGGCWMKVDREMIERMVHG